MSKIALSPNASGSGTLTIAAPGTNTDRTLNLPDAGGDIVIDTATQTLTNKTLTSPTLSSPTISGTPVVSGGLITSDTAKASTSGTTVDFTGIPSWVKRITVMFNGVSTSSTGDVSIRLGTGGSFIATGYTSNATIVSSGTSTQASTTGFYLTAGALGNTEVYSGIVILANVTGNTWAQSGNVTRNGTGGVMVSAGSIALSGVLDSIRVIASTGNFDAGSINILYE